MSAPTNIDFIKGFDFTGAATLTPGDLNTLVDLATPYEEILPLEGKGLNIVTQDALLDTPSVPDANSVTKWRRYIWIRRPHSTAASTAPILYTWDDNVVSDATYLKWVAGVNEATLQASIDSLEVDVATLQSNQTNQGNQLNAISGVANQAQADATEALEAIPTIAALLEAVTVTLPAADTANAAAAAAASVIANQANANALAVAGTTRFTSADYAIADGAIADEVHNLGAAPKFIRWVMVAQNPADTGFTAGDEVDVDCFCMQDAQIPMFSYGANATKVFIAKSTSAGDESVTRRDNGVYLANIDVTKWKLRCYAWKG